MMNNKNLSTTEIQQYQMQQMLQQNYDNSLSTPIVYNNNPKLRNIKEPFIIPAYGQLKQPNTNSTFQSSVTSEISCFADSEWNYLFVCFSRLCYEGYIDQLLSD